MSLDVRAQNERVQQTATLRGGWAQAHAGFLRAVLLILVYCFAVISMISMIAFRGVQTVAIIAGVICIAAVVTIFLLPRSGRSAR